MPALLNVYLDDSDVFEEWITQPPNGLHGAINLEALTTLPRSALHSGQYHRPQKPLPLRQLSYDNLREEAHQQLMEALVLSGRRKLCASTMCAAICYRMNSAFCRLRR